VSGIVEGKLHSSSNLRCPTGYSVLVSALIKFRAGPHTDAVGIDKTGSSWHVPWVWCEYAVVRDQKRYKLLALGSSFPSHAWYVNGQQVGQTLQKAIAASEIEPAISSGQASNKPLLPGAQDRSTGSVERHLFSIGRGRQLDIDISDYFDEKNSPRVLR
jgi:hypothetical protein